MKTICRDDWWRRWWWWWWWWHRTPMHSSSLLGSNYIWLMSELLVLRTQACRFQRGAEPRPSCWHVRIWRIKPHSCSDQITEHGHRVLHATWWTSSNVIRRSCLSDSQNVITNGTRDVIIRNVHRTRKWDGRAMRHASTWLEKCLHFCSENPKGQLRQHRLRWWGRGFGVGPFGFHKARYYTQTMRKISWSIAHC